jgi:hypothetical protein
MKTIVEIIKELLDLDDVYVTNDSDPDWIPTKVIVD